MLIDTLPPINAALNAAAAILLMTAIPMAKRAAYRAHASLTISAFVLSLVFLCLYIYHKYLRYLAYGTPETSTADVHPVILRQLYLWILLLPHLILAIVMMPMILTTFFLAWRRKWDWHRKLARPTFYIWVYVSLSGVAVYFTLYHLFPHFRTS